MKLYINLNGIIRCSLYTTNDYSHSASPSNLLCNMSALAANGSFVGFRVALLFFWLAFTVSGLTISLKVHGHPSIGASGVIYAFDYFWFD